MLGGQPAQRLVVARHAAADHVEPHALCQIERSLARGIELAHHARALAQQLHHELIRHAHVPLDHVIRQVPAALLRDDLERTLPALGLGQTHHAAEQAATGAHREDGRRQDAIEVRIGARMVHADDVHRRARVLIAQVGLETALPV